MKKIILLLFAVCILLNDVKSQTDEILYKQGIISLTGGIPSIGFGGGMFVFNSNVRAGIFVLNRLNVGLDVEGTYYGKSIYSRLNLKPSIKYYVLNKKITPVLSAGYNWQMIFLPDEVYVQQSPFLGLGVSLMNKSGNFGVEAGFEYNLNRLNSNSNIKPYVGFNFYLNRKKKDKLPE